MPFDGLYSTMIMEENQKDAMSSDVHPPRGDLMKKALNYLNIFWTQLLAYNKDCSCTIDNSIDERFICHCLVSGRTRYSLAMAR